MPAVEQWRYRNKLEYSFGTGDGRRARVRLPRARPLGRDRADRRLPARLRARQRGARAGAARGAARQGLRRLRPPRRSAACCATSSCARAGAPASCRCGSSPRPGELDADALIDAVDADGLFWTQTAERSARPPRAARPSCSHGSAAAARGARRAALPDLARGVLPDQHRDGRAALRRSRPSTPALRGCERVFDLYCGIGTIGLSLRRAGARGRRASRSSSRRSPTRSTTRALNEIDNARFFAGDVRLALRELVEQAGRPDVAVVDPPRAGLSQKVVRRIIEAAPTRIVYVSCNPTTLAPERGAARRGRLRARARAAGRHVPADAAHRVRGAARARVSGIRVARLRRLRQRLPRATRTTA